MGGLALSSIDLPPGPVTRKHGPFYRVNWGQIGSVRPSVSDAFLGDSPVPSMSESLSLAVRVCCAQRGWWCAEFDDFMAFYGGVPH